MPTYRFYDNLSIVALGSLVFCGVGGAAVWLGVAASGGLAAAGDSWDQESGLTWLTLSSVGTLVSLVLLVWACVGKQSYRPRSRLESDSRSYQGRRV